MQKKLYLRRIALKMALIIYDIIAINISFILTLYIRFYVAREMHAGSVVFFELFTSYAPFYTIFCIVVFAGFKLYSGMWKYAGFNDLNRILTANVVCVIGHVVGTLLFVQRMPRSFYILGGVIQLILISFARFSFKLMEIEKSILFGTKKNSDIRAMIVGINNNTRSLIRKLERNNTINPVCIIDYEILGMGNILDGIPVVSGIDKFNDAIKKYSVNYVILASGSMPEDARKQINDICLKCNIEIQNYYDELGEDSSIISYRELLDKIQNDIVFDYNNDFFALEDASVIINSLDRFKIIRIFARSEVVHIEIQKKNDKKLDLNEEWVKLEENKSGKEISFF